MIWVGLTGGIASGKSTVSNFLEHEGAFIIDADRIVHTILRDEKEVLSSILNSFGHEVLDDEKRIDRKRLGTLVFQDREALNRLNCIVHPFVFRYAEAQKTEIAQHHPQAVIVFDAALLIETEAYKNMDWVLLAYVDPITQMRRLMERDHCTKKEAEWKIAAQMPIDEKIVYADEIIDCRQERTKVQSSVHQTYRRLREKAEHRHRSA